MTTQRLGGKLLVAAPVLEDANFARSVVLLVEHGDEGALGVVLNRPSALRLDELMPAWADKAQPPSVLFEGGPVQQGSAIAVARVRPGTEPTEGWNRFSGGLGTLDLAMDPLFATGVEEVRVYLGYAGWGAGQLEGELAAGAWFVVDALESDVFCEEPNELWRSVLRRQRTEVRIFANFPEHPSLN